MPSLDSILALVQRRDGRQILDLVCCTGRICNHSLGTRVLDCTVDDGNDQLVTIQTKLTNKRRSSLFQE
jgi:hypothetical protein